LRSSVRHVLYFHLFYVNEPSPTEVYTLSLHDALPISCITESGIDRKTIEFPSADVLGEMISLALNMRNPLVQLLEEEFDYFVDVAPQIEDVQKRYATRKRETDAMDFDDLLALWLKLLEQNEEVRENYQRR